MIRGVTTNEARALVCLALLAAIFTILATLSAHGADSSVTECSAARGRDNAYWSWREIDQRRCWYRGQPGRAKALLRWSLSSPRPSSVAAERPEIEQAPSKVAEIESRADSSEELTARAVMNKEALWQANPEDQTKAFTCCWPELPERSVENSQPVKAQDRYPAIELPRATPPATPVWPLLFLPVIVVAVSVFLARRKLQ